MVIGLDRLCVYAQRIYQFVLFVLSPPRCAQCGCYLRERSVFCSSCSKKVCPVVSVALPITKNKMITVYAAARYQEPIKSLILAKRWSSVSASVQLAEYIVQSGCLDGRHIDCLVPIPLHWTREVARGYNHAQEIARELGKRLDVSVALLLRRSKRTAYQTTIPHADRAKNVHKAFVGARSLSAYTGKHIMLVDDVMTTGATLQEAARVLSAARPASLTAVVAARAVQ